MGHVARLRPLAFGNMNAPIRMLSNALFQHIALLSLRPRSESCSALGLDFVGKFFGISRPVDSPTQSPNAAKLKTEIYFKELIQRAIAVFFWLKRKAAEKFL
jgi:hypothetical protein